jgi:hypothetical protein
MYIWGIDRNGWANAYYSAAVQAGQYDLKAFLFGAADWGNSITVDKPPLSLWIMGLSARMFGLNPWALLLPSGRYDVNQHPADLQNCQVQFSSRCCPTVRSRFRGDPHNRPVG